MHNLIVASRNLTWQSQYTIALIKSPHRIAVANAIFLIWWRSNYNQPIQAERKKLDYSSAESHFWEVTRLRTSVINIAVFILRAATHDWPAPKLTGHLGGLSIPIGSCHVQWATADGHRCMPFGPCASDNSRWNPWKHRVGVGSKAWYISRTIVFNPIFRCHGDYHIHDWNQEWSGDLE